MLKITRKGPLFGTWQTLIRLLKPTVLLFVEPDKESLQSLQAASRVRNYRLFLKSLGITLQIEYHSVCQLSVLSGRICSLYM